MIAPSNLLVATFGVALATFYLRVSDGCVDDVLVESEEFIVPKEYKLRKDVSSVVEEFRKLFDSVFIPLLERPYDEGVRELLLSMCRFLNQSPQLKYHLLKMEIDEVQHYSTYLKDPNDLTTSDLENLNARHVDWKLRQLPELMITRRVGPTSMFYSPLDLHLRSLLNATQKKRPTSSPEKRPRYGQTTEPSSSGATKPSMDQRRQQPLQQQDQQQQPERRQAEASLPGDAASQVIRDAMSNLESIKSEVIKLLEEVANHHGMSKETHDFRVLEERLLQCQLKLDSIGSHTPEIRSKRKSIIDSSESTIAVLHTKVKLNADFKEIFENLTST